MAKQNYDESLRRLLVNEGGYGNHPSDPGGPTNFGITLKDYRLYVNKSATAADIRAMKIGEAKTIYRAKYWDALKCDDLPSGVDYSIFDYGVNSGVGRAGKVLRRKLGMPTEDAKGKLLWAVTPEVIAAANKVSAFALVSLINNERLSFLKQLRTWPVFGRGWGRRVSEVKTYSLSLVGKRVPP